MESSRPLMDFLPKSLYTIQSSLEVQLGCMSNDVHNTWLYHELADIPLTKDCLLMNSNNYYITSRCYLQAIVISISREETWDSRTSLTGCQLQGTPQHTCTGKEKIYAASSDCNPIFWLQSNFHHLYTLEHLLNSLSVSATATLSAVPSK